MKRPIVFGEVLFDVLPDGREILGGAPFNVAWHLQGFGCKPLMISRVGRDERGERIRARMQAWGMDLAGLQIDDEHATGAVQVSLIGGQPSYEILPNRAYDFIEVSALDSDLLQAREAILVHGSLAARGAVSAQALHFLIERYGLPVFLDVNLRSPWWQRESVQELMADARWIKLNLDELRLLVNDGGDAEGSTDELIRNTGAEWVLVTAGEKGAFLRDWNGRTFAAPAANAAPFVDAIGAGDAFCSVILRGILAGWAEDVALARAAQFAGEICKIAGATTENRDLYARLLREWEAV